MARLIIFTVAIFSMFFSCTSSKDLNAAIADNSKEGAQRRLDLANKYFDEDDYYKAIQLYEVVINERILVDDLELVYFRYANSHFAQYDYATASNLYNTFYLSYPDSENAETAYYYRALCSYELAEADHRLDQETLLQSMREFQDYVITFPGGEHEEEALNKIEEIRVINERKKMSIGDLYAQIGEYKAAIAEYNRFIEDNPSSYLAEETYYKLLKTRLSLANKSVEHRKIERYELVLTHYEYFMEKYSTGPYAQEVKEIKNQAEQELSKLKS